MRQWYKVIVALLAALSTKGGCGRCSGQEWKIDGPRQVQAYQLVRLRVDAPKGAAIIWRVSPAAMVSRATTTRGILEFVAPPGKYSVDALVIRNIDDGIDVQEAQAEVVINAPPAPTPPTPTPPTPTPPTPPSGKLDPVNAIGRIQFGSAGCTATVIGPRRADGKWDVLTAAHCVSGVGAVGTMRMKDGRTISLKIVAHQRGPDVAWAVTEESGLELPFAYIAKENPAIGVKVWHMGYGVDRPANREDGSVSGVENAQGQLRFQLSVSSGDSGGAILRSDTNEVVSCVCCTASRGQSAPMWGCSTAKIHASRPAAKTEESDDWHPIEIPICRDNRQAESEEKAQSIAERFGCVPVPPPFRENKHQ